MNRYTLLIWTVLCLGSQFMLYDALAERTIPPSGPRFYEAAIKGSPEIWWASSNVMLRNGRAVHPRSAASKINANVNREMFSSDNETQPEQEDENHGKKVQQQERDQLLDEILKSLRDP